MKRKAIISVSTYLLHAISVFLYVVCSAKNFFWNETIIICFVITYVTTFPLVPSILSIYDLIENIIKKSYKNVMTWICGVVGFLIVILYLRIFLDSDIIIISLNSIVFKITVIGVILILTHRIGEFILRRSENKKITNTFYICSGIVILMIAVVFLWNSLPRYNENWIMGKTAEEIQEKYGKFDIKSVRYDTDKRGYSIPDKDGKLQFAGYSTKPEKVGFFGTSPEEYFLIYFNGDGLAYRIEEDWVVPGG